MKKKIFASLVVAATISSSLAGAAVAASKTCDNDSTTNGCTTTAYGNWSYISSSTSYNRNYEQQRAEDQISKRSSQYLYGLSTGLTSSRGINYYAYLNSTSITCRYAEYDSVSGNLTTLNQDTAPGGWNYLGNDTDYSVVPVSVYSGAQDGNLGADAIEISW